MAMTGEQMRVVLHDGEHAVVGAVAGSGKSTTLVHRIVYLLKHGVAPADILVMMFNKTAQQDFKKRLFRQLKKKELVASLKVKTFHAYGMELLEKFIEEQLLPPAKLMTHDWEVANLGREALAYANGLVNEEERVDVDTEAVGELLTIIDLAKSNLYEADDLRLEVKSKVYRDAFRAFEAMRKERELRTFADLIFDPTKLLVSGTGPARERALRIAANRFKHIILDEYQDINEGQQALVKVVAGKTAKVMAVGDEDQCIYAWRGAKPEYMTERFEDDFPGATRYKLSRTFRFGHAISIAADHVITHNQARTDKLCISGSKFPWTTIRWMSHLSNESSGTKVMDAVNEWMTKGRKASEIAILVREYSHTLPVEVSLMTAGTPYKLEGAEPALDRRELKAMRGYVMLAAKGFGALEEKERKEVFEAMLVTPTLYLKGEVRDALVASMAENFASPEVVLLRAADKAGRASGQTLREAADHWGTITKLGPEAKTSAVLEEIRALLSLDKYFERQHAHPETQREKKMMLDEYHRFAQQLDLTAVDFCARIRELMQSVRDGGEDVLLLTSVHRSKGLEWPHVILPELADGKFPSFTGKNPSPEVLEEERRLFYVAMTRAQEKLTLISPWDRNLKISMSEKKGSTLDKGTMYASRFLYEANIILAREMGNALHKDESPRTGYAALPTEIAERYLNDVEAARAAPKEPVVDRTGRRVPQISADAPFTPSLF